MQKKTLKFSFYLLLFSFIAKILSFLARIFLARNISTLSMSYYTIISPTIVILISCVQMGIPSVLSKMVANKKYNFKILSTSIYFNIFTTTITILLYILFIPFLSHLLYKQAFYPIFYSILPYLPSVALSGLLKGYLMGRQKFISSSFSQIIEEIARIVFLIIIFYFIEINDPIVMTQIAIFSNIVGECVSILYMLLIIYLDKRKILKKLEYSKIILQDILKHALPLSGSRFIGSLSYFLEPILMNLNTNTLQRQNMILAYGNLNGYVLPLLTMPSFLSFTLAGYLLPSFSYHSSRNQTKYANTLFFSILYFSFFITMIYYLLLLFFSDEICLFFYNNIAPSQYLKLCAMPFMIYTLQPILSVMMHNMELSKYSMVDTLSGSIVRLLIVSLLTPLLNEYTLVLGLCIGMIITTSMHLYHVFIKQKDA